MTISRRTTSLAVLAFSIAFAGCGSEKGVGIATPEDAAATAKAAPESATGGGMNPKSAKRPKIQAEGSAASLKLEN